jgi:cytochrome c oxidase subunit 3
MVLVLSAIALIAGWWLVRNGIVAKPWLEQGVIDDPRMGTSRIPAAKVGLGVLLAIIAALFALLISAYSMRMHITLDWRPLPDPAILWVNTGMLALSSVALVRANRAAQHAEVDALRANLLIGGGLAVAFLVGQLIAWRELVAAGYGAAANPANGFFYLLTGMHGLHILAGLAALGAVTARIWRGARPAEMRLAVELCGIYWHFLLLVWLVLFGLLLLT